MRETKKLRNMVVGYTAMYPKRFKFVFGERMMNIVLDMGRNIRRANRATDPRQRYHHIEEVLILVEDMEDLVDASFEHKALSVKQVASLSALMVSKEWWRHCYVCGRFERVKTRRKSIRYEQF